MEKYCLYVLFQLKTDTGESHQYIFSLGVDCEDLDQAKNLLNEKISEKLSYFSTSGLNWKIIEKHVKLESHAVDAI